VSVKGKDAPDSLRPQDAVASSWVERLPVSMQPYARLMRLDRPIGTWLLLWPCLWAVLLLADQQSIGQLLRLILLFSLGAIVMRAAGCVLNDIIDADLDARVARTAGRPIPSGQVSKPQAWLFLAGLLLAGLLILLQFKFNTILLGFASLLLVAPYPLMKRITWWPQAWLGLTFNYGILLAWVEVTDTLSLPALLLYAAGLFWTLGYDTIYALQDREDDRAAGIRSSALALGDQVKPAVGGFYAVMAILLVVACGLRTGWGWRLVLVLPVALHLTWQVWRLQPDSAAMALSVFRSNREAGLLVALACLALAGLQAIA
jgi:4-hydroxybenzoate polyprenyltransferase